MRDQIIMNSTKSSRTNVKAHYLDSKAKETSMSYSFAYTKQFRFLSYFCKAKILQKLL